MANSPQAIKRAKQNAKRNLRNTSQRSGMRTVLKKVIAAIKEGSKEKATETYKNATSSLDRMAGRGLIHANKAARLKSRLNAKIKAL